MLWAGLGGPSEITFSKFAGDRFFGEKKIFFVTLVLGHLEKGSSGLKKSCWPKDLI